jgi:hypothetical protein
MMFEYQLSTSARPVSACPRCEEAGTAVPRYRIAKKEATA